MGYELWIDRDLAWARGTYEYRPMGAAVIAASDLFRARDFHPRPGVPASGEYLGQFASVGAVNAELQRRRVPYFHMSCLYTGDDTRLGLPAWDSLEPYQPVTGWIAVSPDLRTAVALFEDQKGWHLVLRDVQTGKTLGQPPENNPDVNAATFSPDGARVGTVGDNQCGRIWDVRSGQPL